MFAEDYKKYDFKKGGNGTVCARKRGRDGRAAKQLYSDMFKKRELMMILRLHRLMSVIQLIRWLRVFGII